MNNINPYQEAVLIIKTINIISEVVHSKLEEKVNKVIKNLDTHYLPIAKEVFDSVSIIRISYKGKQIVSGNRQTVFNRLSVDLKRI